MNRNDWIRWISFASVLGNATDAAQEILENQNPVLRPQNFVQLCRKLQEAPQEFVKTHLSELFSEKRSDLQEPGEYCKALTDQKNWRKHILTLLKSPFTIALLELNSKAFEKILYAKANSPKTWKQYLSSLLETIPQKLNFARVMTGLYQEGVQKQWIILDERTTALRTLHHVYEALPGLRQYNQELENGIQNLIQQQDIPPAPIRSRLQGKNQKIQEKKIQELQKFPWNSSDNSGASSFELPTKNQLKQPLSNESEKLQTQISLKRKSPEQSEFGEELLDCDAIILGELVKQEPVNWKKPNFEGISAQIKKAFKNKAGKKYEQAAILCYLRQIQEFAIQEAVLKSGVELETLKQFNQEEQESLRQWFELIEQDPSKLYQPDQTNQTDPYIAIRLQKALISSCELAWEALMNTLIQFTEFEKQKYGKRHFPIIDQQHKTFFNFLVKIYS